MVYFLCVEAKQFHQTKSNTCTKCGENTHIYTLCCKHKLHVENGPKRPQLVELEGGDVVINTQRHVTRKKGCWPLKTTLQPVCWEGRKLGFNAQSTVMVVSGPIQALEFNLSSVQGHLRTTETLVTSKCIFQKLSHM